MSDTPHDPLGDALRNEIPEPAPGYWAEIDARIASAAAEKQRSSQQQPIEVSSASSDTEDVVIRPTDMNNTTPTNQTRNRVLLGAAAGVTIVAGLFGLISLRDTTSEVDVTNTPDSIVSTTTTIDEGSDTTVAPVETTDAQTDTDVTLAENVLLNIEASDLACYEDATGPIQTDGDAGYWLIGGIDDQVVSYFSPVDATDDSRILTVGTLGADNTSIARSRELASGREYSNRWQFGPVSVQAAEDWIGFQIECEGIDVESLTSTLRDELARIEDEAARFGIQAGEPGLAAIAGDVASGDPITPARFSPGDGIEDFFLESGTHNLRTSGRTATVDGVAYTELAVHSFADFQSPLRWVPTDALTESLTIDELVASAGDPTRRAIGILQELKALEGDRFAVVIEGQEIPISIDAKINLGPYTDLLPLIEEGKFGPGSVATVVIGSESGVAAVTSLQG